MKERSSELYLEDIINAINRIFEYTKNLSYNDFCEDSNTCDAVVRNYGIIGEAAKNFSDELKSTHPEIPWKEMAGMCDQVIHAYFGVDMDIVWETSKNMLPELKCILEKISKK